MKGRPKGKVAAVAEASKIRQRRIAVTKAVIGGKTQKEAAAAAGVSEATVARDVRSPEGQSLLARFAAKREAKMEELYDMGLQSLEDDFKDPTRRGYARQDLFKLIADTDKANGAGREGSAAPGSFTIHDLLVSVQQTVIGGPSKE
jgi:hypothetical protein